ncbi:large ribosomal subunit protein uL18m-like [Ruditapes philippinarum]|uniref:large ribosomal subunit protein uL18m-like n=1 Tax=Ruditapes philippinarum TaxID=129788 RepID=UPI00295BA79B|nr:large ribosomal subunit protein uL18m-like [Ruditapes philippinarum]
MNKILSLRLISPALLDTTAFSCKTLSNTVANGSRCLSTKDPKKNKNIEVNPLFTNRNPRALEQMGLEPKRKGWKFQAPRKDFYHRLVYDSKKTKAYIEHWKGKIVLEASSSEPNVLKYLYNAQDVSANRNIGHLLARRMLEAGITRVFYEAEADDATSLKRAAFLQALKENEIELSEPDEVVHEVIPGIDYEGYNRLNEQKVYKTSYQYLHKKSGRKLHRSHPLSKIKVRPPKFEM